jgi:hypothetical protein
MIFEKDMDRNMQKIYPRITWGGVDYMVPLDVSSYLQYIIS